LKAAKLGHTYVHQDDSGPEFNGPFDCFDTVGGLTDNLNVIAELQKCDDPLSDKCVVIRDQYAYLRHLPPGHSAESACTLLFPSQASSEQIIFLPTATPVPSFPLSPIPSLLLPDDSLIDQHRSRSRRPQQQFL